MNLVNQELNFEWDEGNKNKNLLKHDLANDEIEEAFFDPDKKISFDKVHSDYEQRFILLGKTMNGRIIFVVFTYRDFKIRVISARDINQKELDLYL